MSAGDQGEKQFDPTPQRREEFRKQGRFARARDAAPVAGMLAVVGGAPRDRARRWGGR